MCVCMFWGAYVAAAAADAVTAARGKLTWGARPCAHAESIRPALGRAGKVVCAVGASESELTDFTAPRRIDGTGATRLVEAATAAGVSQFVLVTSLGTGKLGWPAGEQRGRRAALVCLGA